MSMSMSLLSMFEAHWPVFAALFLLLFGGLHGRSVLRRREKEIAWLRDRLQQADLAPDPEGTRARAEAARILRLRAIECARLGDADGAQRLFDQGDEIDCFEETDRHGDGGDDEIGNLRTRYENYGDNLPKRVCDLERSLQVLAQERDRAFKTAAGVANLDQFVTLLARRIGTSVGLSPEAILREWDGISSTAAKVEPRNVVKPTSLYVEMVNALNAIDRELWSFPKAGGAWAFRRPASGACTPST